MESNLSSLIILKTSGFVVPTDVQVANKYGYETIVINDEHTNRVSGTSMVVRGTVEALRKMIDINKGVWTSNNPMFGDWNFKTI